MEGPIAWSVNRATPSREGAPTADSDFESGAISDWEEGSGWSSSSGQRWWRSRGCVGGARRQRGHRFYIGQRISVNGGADALCRVRISEVGVATVGILR
jgi:hypothetical protein